MRTVPYCSNTFDIQNHYCQSGGNIPIFVGDAIQRGNGLGNILSGIARSAIPILKKTVLPAVIRSGKEVLSDVITKRKNLKQSLIDTSAKRLEEFVGNIPETRKRKQQVKTKSRIPSKRVKAKKRYREFPIF